MSYTTINQVLETLEEIIGTSEQNDDRAGYFAALYHKVTSRVKEGIEKNDFEDPARMERLDVLFANRYLEAYKNYRAGLPLTKSWKIAFDTTKRRSPLVLQHLLLGINAHINLDLGIAAVQTIQDHNLQSIRKDFAAINDILGSLCSDVMRELSRISPFLSLLGLHASQSNTLLIQFSIANARDGAWVFAEELALKTGDEVAACIDARDHNIAILAKTLTKSKGLLRLTLWLVHSFELKKPARIIRELNTYRKQYLRARNISPENRKQ